MPLPVADRVESDVAHAPVRPVISVAVVVIATLTAGALVIGAQVDHAAYAVVVFMVQGLFILAVVLGSQPAGPVAVAVTGGVTAALADIAALVPDQPTLSGLAYVLGAGFLVAFVGQLARREDRTHATESLAASAFVAAGVVGLASLIVLTRRPVGTQALDAGVLAAGLALVIAHLTDLFAPRPRLSNQVPRGGAGLVAGAVGGTAAAAWLGGQLVGLTPVRTAALGMLAALVAVFVDLGVGYAEAGRRTHEPSSELDAVEAEAPAGGWLVSRHLLGPLVALAATAPVIYLIALGLLGAR